MRSQTFRAVCFIALAVFIGTASAAMACDAYPGEQCPSAEFLTEYNGLLKLQKDLDGMQRSAAVRKFKAKSDQLVGAGRRVGSMIPPGFGFDEKKQKFVASSGNPYTGPTRTIDAPPAPKPEEKK